MRLRIWLFNIPRDLIEKRNNELGYGGVLTEYANRSDS